MTDHEPDWHGEAEAEHAFQEDLLARADWTRSTFTSETLTREAVDERPDLWKSVTQIDRLGTASGWAVLRHELRQGGHPALENQPPPAVRWRYVEGEVEFEGEYGEAIHVPVNAMLVTVALRRFPEPRHLLWLVQRRHVLVELTEALMTEQANKVGALRVIWHTVTRPDSGQDTWLEHSDQIAAAVKLMAREAQERFYVEVPWWRTDNAPGAAVLDEVTKTAGRGVDCKVLMRSPDQRGVFNPEQQRAVVERLRGSGAAVAFNPQSHQKIFIADDTVLTSSSNLTQSDTWLDNAGPLMFDTEASRRAIEHFRQRWYELGVVAQMTLHLR